MRKAYARTVLCQIKFILCEKKIAGYEFFELPAEWGSPYSKPYIRWRKKFEKGG